MADVPKRLDDPTTYDDLLVRNSTTDSGQVPAAGALCHSPDLIPYGTQAVDPQIFLKTMSEDVGRNVLANEPNYIYGRGVNLAGATASGTLHLYACLSTILAWPQQWQPNEIPLNDGTFGAPVSAAAGGDFVTTAPFYWNAPPVPADNHYCLVGRMVTTAHPNPIPSVLQLDDFASYVASNRGMSWRNVAIVDDPDVPTFSTNVQYDQGTVGEQIYLVLVCDNVPNGAAVAFTCGTPGPDPLLNLQQTTISTFPHEVLGVTSQIPAGFSSEITYSYWSNGVTLPPNAAITLQAIYVPPAGARSFGLGVDVRTLGITDDMLAPQHRELASVGPVTGVVLGQHTTTTAG